MDVIQRIKKQLNDNTITLYIRGSEQKPMCLGSERIIKAISLTSGDFLVVNVQEDPEVRAFVPKFSDWSKFPQMFLQGEFVGGTEVVMELAEQGELAKMVDACQPEREAKAS